MDDILKTMLNLGRLNPVFRMVIGVRLGESILSVVTAVQYGIVYSQDF